MCRGHLFITFFLFLLAGCLRPNYQPQEVNVPQTWRLETSEGSTLCNLHWWEQFQDPVLNQLIVTALQNNQDLQVAIWRVFEYYDRFGATSAAAYPTLYGNGMYNRVEDSLAVPLPVPPRVRTNNDYQLFFSLSWELDFWGRIYSASEAAYADLLGQIEARRAVVLTVVTSVADAYIVLRQLDAQLVTSRETLKSRMESLKLAQDRFQLGETSELEVKQAEAEVESAAISVIEFERDIPQQENRLSILLGQNPHAILRGQPLDAFKYPVEIPAGLPSDLLLRRPDIMEAEDKLIAANARVTEARALFFPQINLTAQFGSESDRLSRFLTSPAEMWQYGLSAVQTLFDAGKIGYTVMASEAVREEALANYRQTILTAFSEVENALVAYKKNRELVLEHKKQVQVLTDYLNLAKLRYDEGEVDYLNVLDAERTLFDAQLSLAQSQSDSFTAIVQLYGALGGGWVTDADADAIGKQMCPNEKGDKDEDAEDFEDAEDKGLKRE